MMPAHSKHTQKTASSGARRSFLGLALYGATLSALAAPTGQVGTSNGGSPCGTVQIAPMMTVPVGKSTVIRPETPITRILLGNPDQVQAGRPAENSKDDERNRETKDDGRPGVAQVDVLLLSPNEIYLLGKSVGSTNVVLVDREGRCTALDVTVAMDVTAVRAVLTELLPGENDIKVTAAYDSLVLSGTVSDATKVDRAVELASTYVRQRSGAQNAGNSRIVNLLQVGAPQQVMLEVKVAEVSKAMLDRFGIDITRAVANSDGTAMRFLSGIFGGRGAVGGQVAGTVGARVGGGVVGSVGNGTSTSALTGPLGSATIGGDTTTIPLIGGKNATMVSVDAQKTDGLVKILAEPTVMAISGQEGAFLAGGKIFIPVAQSDGGGGRTITLEEKEFGVSVKFTPTVLEGGRINLKVAPEVSELNREGVGISAPGVSGLAVLPSFTTRRAFTTVQLSDGQSFAIGGLIKNNATTNIRAFPFLGEIPVLGALFRSTEFQTDRSELVFIITPRLVKPLPSDYALPTDSYIEPSRAAVILGGKMEGQPPADHQGRSSDEELGGGFDSAN